MKVSQLSGLILVLVVFFHSKSISQSYDNGIVKIETRIGNRAGSTGTGIVVGQKGERVFIITANHVLKKVDQIHIRFKDLSWSSFPGEKFDKNDPIIDLAVIVVRVPEAANLKFYRRKLTNWDQLAVNDPILCIGNPSNEEFEENTLNHLTDLQFQTYLLKFSASGIEKGYSGGPILERKKKRLIGMILNVNNNRGEGVRIDQIIEKLEEWLIPRQYLVKAPRPMHKLTIPLGMASATSAYLGTNFNQRIVDNEEDIEGFQTKSAAERELGKSIEYMEDIRNENARLRNFSYAGAATFALIDLWLNVKKKKNKEPKADLDEEVPNFFNFLNFSEQGLSFGIAFRF